MSYNSEVSNWKHNIRKLEQKLLSVTDPTERIHIEIHIKAIKEEIGIIKEEVHRVKQEPTGDDLMKLLEQYCN